MFDSLPSLCRIVITMTAATRVSAKAPAPIQVVDRRRGGWLGGAVTTRVFGGGGLGFDAIGGRGAVFVSADEPAFIACPIPLSASNTSFAEAGRLAGSFASIRITR